MKGNIKVQSKICHEVGTKLQDKKTKEVFKVIKTHNIDILGKVNYGLTLRRVK